MRYNSIDKLQVGEEIIEDKEQIKKEILDFYKGLYTKHVYWRPTLTFKGMVSITEEESLNLETIFEEEEVLAAIQSCIMGTLNYYDDHCWMVRSCNASFIAMIPKKKGVMELKDYRPISLIRSIYKIIAKILAERLKSVMEKLVSNQKNAFIKNRQITDASLIAN
ncbi:uncharacterized protein LOC142182303 [Nicotiana tabacum]|uniref:Uncharacterized protein LOC142182303 n=1 Tax=Nicotiana tabacum TaxID=4097 RepID=A0AC58UT06_TOBAC